MSANGLSCGQETRLARERGASCLLFGEAIAVRENILIKLDRCNIIGSIESIERKVLRVTKTKMKMDS